MLKFICSGIVSFTLVSCIAVHAQGTNNNYPLDSIDIKKSLELVGIQVFKFPVAMTAAGKYRINFVVEHLSQGKTVQTINAIEDIKKRLPQGIDPKRIPLDYIAPVLDSGSNLIRMYIKHNQQTEVSCTWNVRDFSQTIRLDIDTAKYAASQSRAFNYRSIKPGERTPLVVFYMNAKETPLLSCPGNATPADIIKLYPYTVIIYGELIPLEP